MRTVRKILWDFHYNSGYSPPRAEHDLNAAYARKRMRDIRWTKRAKCLNSKSWWIYGYLAGRHLWSILYSGMSEGYCLYDNAGLFYTERMNPSGHDTMKEAKQEAQERTMLMLARMMK